MRTDQKLFCLKCLLTIFLSILWLVAAAIFGVLLWMRLDYWTNEYLLVEPSLESYLILIYVTLAAGGVLVIFSVFGLIGGCLKSKWLIVIYLTAVCVAIVLTVSSVVYGIIYKHDLEETIVRDNLLKKVIEQKYIDQSSSRVRRSIDIMQKELECCGGQGPDDYTRSVWASLDTTGERQDKKMVPATCCKDYLKYQDRNRECFIYQQTNTNIGDNQRSDLIWQQGCQEKLKEYFDAYVIAVIGIGAAYFVLMLVCLIICSVYVNLLNNLYVPQPDDIVYDMAHNQEKSPYPSRGDYREYYH